MKAFAASFGSASEAGRMLICRLLLEVAPQFLSKLTYFHWPSGEKCSAGASFSQQPLRLRHDARAPNTSKRRIPYSCTATGGFRLRSKQVFLASTRKLSCFHKQS